MSEMFFPNIPSEESFKFLSIFSALFFAFASSFSFSAFSLAASFFSLNSSSLGSNSVSVLIFFSLNFKALAFDSSVASALILPVLLVSKGLSV